MTKHTLEQQIKFDSGLSIGQHCVTVYRRDGSCYVALVDISSRGVVKLIQKPRDDQMYTSWHRVKGDAVEQTGATIVWGARNPEMLALFDNPTGIVQIV